MAKQTVSEGLQAMIDTIAKKRTHYTLADFDQHAVVNAMDSVYEKGTILHFPTLDVIESRIDIEEFPMTSTGRIPRAPYIVVDTERHGPKKVFLSQLTRTIMPYVMKGGEAVQEGAPVHGSGKLYDKVSQQRNAGDVIRAIAGHDVVVKDVITVPTARYSNSVIIGVRNAQLTVFDFVD